MRKLLFLMMAIVLATSVFAASTSMVKTSSIVAKPTAAALIVVCPTSAQITADLTSCRMLGGTGTTYKDGNCERVKCLDKTGAPIDLTPKPAEPEVECPDAEAMIAKCMNSNYEYTTTVDKNGCRQIECTIPETTCPSNDATERKCKAAGMDVEYYYDARECKIAQCVGKIESPCPTEDDLQAAIQKCKENDMSYEIYNDAPTTAVAAVQDCMRVRCTEIESNCPSAEDMKTMIEECKKKSMDYKFFVDPDGCKSVQCIYQPTTTLECRKAVKGDCVEIYCSDGTYFNTCDMQNLCSQVECKRYKTEEGCIKTVCSDGSEKTTDCPNSDTEVECSVTTDNQGCKVKRCTDGQVFKSCPDNTGCTESTDQNGCTIKTCPTHVERNCPDQQTSPFSCNYYTDDSTGCVVTQCTNGLEINHCTTEKGTDPTGAEIQCSQYVTGACTIKTCTSGYVLRDCGDGNSVECMVTTTAEGCKELLCSDGTSTNMGCPASAQPTVLTNMPLSNQKLILGQNMINPQPEPPNQIGFWARIRNFFSSSGRPTTPGSTKMFNPQPEPPGKEASSGITTPGSDQAFNPQPEPPGDVAKGANVQN